MGARSLWSLWAAAPGGVLFTTRVLFDRRPIVDCAFVVCCYSQKDGGRLLRQPAHKPDGGGGSGSGAPGERCSSSSGTSGPYNSNHPLLPAQLLPGSTASLNRSLSVMSGLHFGNVLGSGSFGKCGQLVGWLVAGWLVGWLVSWLVDSFVWGKKTGH